LLALFRGSGDVEAQAGAYALADALIRIRQALRGKR